MKFELRQHFQIESARFLPHLPTEHPCHHMHGHSFKIIVLLRASLHPQLGWVRDYNEISALLKPVLQMIDHKVLNEVPGLANPTSEILCRWLYEKFVALIPEVTQITVLETPSTEVSYPAL